MARSLAPYIHVILADVVSITLYINKPLVRLTTAHYQSAVNMISFAQVLTVQWSDTIPKRNVRFQVGITSPDIPFQHIQHYTKSVTSRAECTTGQCHRNCHLHRLKNELYVTRYSSTQVTRWSLKGSLITWCSKSGASSFWISALGKKLLVWR